MCGRFCCSHSAEEIQSRVQHEMDMSVKWVNQERFVPRYNVCPSKYIPVLKMDKQYILEPMSWGYIPPWAKHAPKIRPINARDDTLRHHCLFDASKKTRCVIIADGFYEWKKLENKKKQAHYIKRADGKFMLFAGLYSHPKDMPPTCVIITTEASKLFQQIHTRMPVIMNNEDVYRWLDPLSEWPAHLIQPFQGDLTFYPVTDRVGNIHNESPDFIVPIKENSISQFLKRKNPFPQCPL
ncbi:hypothetical protein BDB01DRAFT_854786 [Pilobolus umbonatus]|nr:hypothetical protein BDB01DRAFT_854786 [Pilobolus umbonatus]